VFRIKFSIIPDAKNIPSSIRKPTYVAFCILFKKVLINKRITQAHIGVQLHEFL
jgi:hypothetical protein